MRHITIYREPGRFAGWPANYGIWSWGNEIVVGFTVGYHKSDAGFHRRDRDRPFTAMQARSLDGGETWVVAETPCELPGIGTLSADEHVAGKHRLQGDTAFKTPQSVNLEHPDFAMMCSRKPVLVLGHIHGFIHQQTVVTVGMVLCNMNYRCLVIQVLLHEQTISSRILKNAYCFLLHQKQTAMRD